MSLFKRLFGQSEAAQPDEPVFPGENFSILKLNMPDGLALATVNKAYENYPNKSFYPFFVGIELEINQKYIKTEKWELIAIGLKDALLEVLSDQL